MNDNPFVYQTDKTAHRSRLVALYSEKKPEEKDFWIEPGQNDEYFDAKEYLKVEKAWQKTVSYAREPEFKVGDEVIFNNEERGTIECIYEDGTIDLKPFERSGCVEFCTDRRYLSHFQEGEQVEVKGWEILDQVVVSKKSELTGEKNEIASYPTWQPVEKPEEMIKSQTFSKIGNEFQEELGYETNPKYTEFHNKVKEGKILTIIEKI